jgi:hypothetical protein
MIGIRETIGMIRNFDELLKAAATVGPKRVAVAALDDTQTITACLEAKKRGVADSVLVGDEEWVKLILTRAGDASADLEIIHEPDPARAGRERSTILRLNSTGSRGSWTNSPGAKRRFCKPFRPREPMQCGSLPCPREPVCSDLFQAAPMK